MNNRFPQDSLNAQAAAEQTSSTPAHMATPQQPSVQQEYIDGIDLLIVNGRRYEWNRTFRAYWSSDGAPRALQEHEIADMDRRDLVAASLAALGYRMEWDEGSIPGEGHSLIPLVGDAENFDPATAPASIRSLAREWSDLADTIAAAPVPRAPTP